MVAAQCIDNLRFLPYWDVITNYSPPINFGAILLVTLCHVVKTVTGQLSCNNPHLSRYLSSDCLHGKETKVGTRVSSFPFSHLFYMEENQTRFVESSDHNIKKLVPNVVLESTKKIN